MPHAYTAYWEVSLRVIWIVNNQHHQWKIYKVWTINMSSFLNQFLHVLLGPISVIMLTIPFWSKKTLCMSSSWSAPKYYTCFVYVWKSAKYMTLMTKHTIPNLHSKEFMQVSHVRWLSNCGQVIFKVGFNKIMISMC